MSWEHAHLYMDGGGTVVAESDLSSQVVELTGGGGSFPTDSLALFYVGGQSFAQDTETDVVGWQVDDSIGTFLTLDPDLTHVVIPSSCIVTVNCTFSFHKNNASTYSFFDVYGDNVFTDDGNAGVVFPIEPGGKAQIGQASYTLRFASAGTVRLKACPLGGSDVETVALGGMNVYRLG